MVSITDVARLAGVTPAVVSRVLNEDPSLRVRKDTRARVTLSAQQLQYTPNHAARSLRSSRTGVLGLAVHDVASPVDSEMVIGAQRSAEDAGYLLILANAGYLARGGEAFRRALHSQVIDGLLLQSSGARADRIVAQAAQTQIPTVMLNDRSKDLASVGVDDYRAAHLATQHLIDLGHTQIGILKTTNTVRARDRLHGFRDALRKAELPIEASHASVGGLTTQSGYKGMKSLLANAKPPVTGVFAANVLAAVGALTAARESRLQVPDDLSIMGFHDTMMCLHTSPQLSVVELPLREMGAQGVNSLLEQIEGAAPRAITLVEPSPKIHIRGSTAPPRSD